MEHHVIDAGELLKISGAYWESCTLHAGVRFGIFTLIGDGSLSSKEIAHKLDADHRAAIMLLNALAAMKLLKKDGDRYANTEESKKLLVKNSPQYIGYMIMHHYHLVDAWGHLPEAVLMGEAVKKRKFNEEEERESFLMGMFNNAVPIAQQVSKLIDLSGRKRLLDMGGGPGTYAIHFCQANPQLKGTVFDLPTTRPYALKTIERFGLSGRVDFISGDYTDDDVPGKYDAVWMSHILHAEGPDVCQMMINKAVSTLEPGGVLLIHDFILNNTMDSPLFATIFSLNMLINTRHGQAYSEGQIGNMMEKAGVKDVRRLDFRGPTDSSIMMGVLK